MHRGTALLWRAYTGTAPRTLPAVYGGRRCIPAERIGWGLRGWHRSGSSQWAVGTADAPPGCDMYWIVVGASSSARGSATLLVVFAFGPITRCLPPSPPSLPSILVPGTCFCHPPEDASERCYRCGAQTVSRAPRTCAPDRSQLTSETQASTGHRVSDVKPVRGSACLATGRLRGCKLHQTATHRRVR